MHEVVLAHEVDWPGWRDAARALILDDIAADNVVWHVGVAQDLLATETTPPMPAPQAAFSVPRRFVELAQTVIQAREPERFALLYRLLRRQIAQAGLLDMIADPEVNRASRLAQAVRRDTHKMRAFVRFRDVADSHVAWFEPSHFIVEANAEFFVHRFATMHWSILTPYRSVHWNGEVLQFAPGAAPADVPDDDALEAYWRTYYAAIFNPARLKVAAMTSEMPRKYWKNLPEARAIPQLVRTARERATRMVEQPVISPDRPLRVRPAPPPAPHAAAACRNCALWQNATQIVFGEGNPNAAIMLIGEQPGDQEDLAGRPFVGPAGKLLDQALAEAGIERAALYITNAVKHFKFIQRGKRRIHQTPDTTEIVACRTWLDLERAQIRPGMTVLMGVSAAQAVLGRKVTISRERGRRFPLGEGLGLVSVHPSYLLRLPDAAARAREYAAFVADLREAARK